MGKINLTNRQARIIAENIFAEIKQAADDKLQKRKDKELQPFIKKITSEPYFINLVKAEQELQKAVKHSNTILDSIVKNLGAAYRYTDYWGESLCRDTKKLYSEHYLNEKISEKFTVDYGTTVDKLESKVVLSVLGKENIDELIKDIKAEYIK